MIVADANLLVYHFIQGVKTELARQVSEADDDWLVPALWRHGFANALAMSVREAGLSPELALSVYDDAQALLSAREQVVNMADALQLAVAHSISVYDAEYVVLAQCRHVPLVTEDKELLRKFPETAISMRGFVSSHSGGTSPSAVREKKTAYNARRSKAVV